MLFPGNYFTTMQSTKGVSLPRGRPMTSSTRSLMVLMCLAPSCPPPSRTHQVTAMLCKGCNYSACLIRSGSTLIAPHSSGGSGGWLMGLGAHLQVLPMLCDVNDGAVFLLKNTGTVMNKKKKTKNGWCGLLRASLTLWGRDFGGPRVLACQGRCCFVPAGRSMATALFGGGNIIFHICTLLSGEGYGRKGWQPAPIPRPCPQRSDPKFSTFRDGIC